MSARPSLHEIAAMPFPASLNAMRKFYDSEWGKGGADPGKWTVRVSYSVTETDWEEIEVEASSEQQAIRLAEKQCEETNRYRDGFEIDDAEVIERPEEVEQ